MGNCQNFDSIYEMFSSLWYHIKIERYSPQFCVKYPSQWMRIAVIFSGILN